MQQKSLYGGVLLKAKEILDFISKCETPPTLKEISNHVSITKPTVLKILTTLEYCDFIRCVGNPKQYYLGLTFLKYAQKAKTSFNLDRIAMPFINNLRDKTTEAVNLGILENNSIALLDRAQSTNTIRLDLQLGGHMSMYSSAMGKAILACFPREKIEDYLDKTALIKLTEKTITNRDDILNELVKTKKRGYGLDIGENQDGICCIGFTIKKNGDVLGAYSISAPIYRVNDSKLNLWIKEGLNTQRKIEAAV